MAYKESWHSKTAIPLMSQKPPQPLRNCLIVSVLQMIIQRLPMRHTANVFETPAACQTRSTALMHPSFSGLFVTWAYLPQTTLPPGVTSPSSLTFTCNRITI